jgi:ketosteroid isomerase-like protein
MGSLADTYFFASFFARVADCAAKMKPYRDAIKAADTNAIVAIFFADAARFSLANPSPWGNDTGPSRKARSPT